MKLRSGKTFRNVEKNFCCEILGKLMLQIATFVPISFSLYYGTKQQNQFFQGYSKT